jgi:hypothetical protein
MLPRSGSSMHGTRRGVERKVSGATSTRRVVAVRRKDYQARRDLSLRSRFQKAELRPQGSLAALEISEN